MFFSGAAGVKPATFLKNSFIQSSFIISFKVLDCRYKETTLKGSTVSQIP